jgi:vacuolar-type H+-ATPase subunit F/Vma7
MKKVAFITPSDALYGFSLTGISQIVGEAGDTEDLITKTKAGQDVGLIIIDERMLNGMTEERLREMEQAWRGILLVLPSPIKPPPEVEDYAARMIRRAIGYHVRLKI